MQLRNKRTVPRNATQMLSASPHGHSSACTMHPHPLQHVQLPDTAHNCSASSHCTAHAIHRWSQVRSNALTMPATCVQVAFTAGSAGSPVHTTQHTWVLT